MPYTFKDWLESVAIVAVIAVLFVVIPFPA
jgi:hypothetical protein